MLPLVLSCVPMLQQLAVVLQILVPDRIRIPDDLACAMVTVVISITQGAYSSRDPMSPLVLCSSDCEWCTRYWSQRTVTFET